MLSQITVVGIFFGNPYETLLSPHNCLFVWAVSCSRTVEWDTECPNLFKIPVMLDDPVTCLMVKPRAICLDIGFLLFVDIYAMSWATNSNFHRASSLVSTLLSSSTTSDEHVIQARKLNNWGGISCCAHVICYRMPTTQSWCANIDSLNMLTGKVHDSTPFLTMIIWSKLWPFAFTIIFTIGALRFLQTRLRRPPVI